MTGLAYSQALTNTCARAEAMAQAMGHRSVGTDHLLLAILDAPEGNVVSLLEHLRLPVETIRRELDDLMPGARAAVTGQLPLTQSASHALSHAEQTASRLTVAEVDTDHLLLGIALGVESLAGRVLLDVGASAEVIRPVIERETGQRGSPVCRSCAYALEPVWRYCPMCATPIEVGSARR